MTSRCRNCQKEILWRKNQSTQQWIPLDIDAQIDYDNVGDYSLYKYRHDCPFEMYWRSASK